MSTPNTEGLAFWNADAVIGTTITLILSYKYNYTADDSASPHHTYTTTIQQTHENIHTLTANRVTSFGSSPAADEFRITVGDGVTIGGPVSANDFPKKLFRNLAALTTGDPYAQAKTDMTWAARAYTEVVDWTYTGPGAPANQQFDTSGTEDVTASFTRTTDQMSWSITGHGFNFYAHPDFTIDPFSLKKSGSDNFGFTNTDTTANPGTVTLGGLTYDVTAWDVETTITVTVS